MNTPDLESILRHRFGFSGFRPGQRELLELLMRGERILSICPTGYGKSLLYQLPAVVLDGLTLVISPLLALMRDQIHQLQFRFSIPAASINSDQGDAANREAIQSAVDGALKLLFLTPERLDGAHAFDLVLSLPVDLLVVDEAHCISTWGHDFRPSYRRIARIIRALETRRPQLRLLALTATADLDTQRDILDQLETDSHAMRVVRQSMDRANLGVSVHLVDGIGDKLAFLAHQLKRETGSSLIYCASRRQTELVADYLVHCGVDAMAFHAGLPIDEKWRLQGEFQSGECPILAATNALGMGIDKKDIRTVYHFAMPGSLSAYYQEVGRAGRDGKPARGVLLYDRRDREIHHYFLDSAKLDSADLRFVMRTMQGERNVSRRELSRKTGVEERVLETVLAILVDQGLVTRVDVGRASEYCLVASDTDLDMAALSRRRERKEASLKEMIAYCESDGVCLMARLRLALGDTDVCDCARCSACAPARWCDLLSKPDAAPAWGWLAGRDQPIRERHPRFLEGQAVLDGRHRSPWLESLMESRVPGSATALPEALLEIAVSKLDALRWRIAFAAIVAVPTRNWQQREDVANLIAARLDLPAYVDELYWSHPPPKWQSECSNYGERYRNVDRRMAFEGSIPCMRGAAIVLLDDFFVSGATLWEAARAIRTAIGSSIPIVPFTIARVFAFQQGVQHRTE